MTEDEFVKAMNLVSEQAEASLNLDKNGDGKVTIDGTSTFMDFYEPFQKTFHRISLIAIPFCYDVLHSKIHFHDFFSFLHVVFQNVKVGTFHEVRNSTTMENYKSNCHRHYLVFSDMLIDLMSSMKASEKGGTDQNENEKALERDIRYLLRKRQAKNGKPKKLNKGDRSGKKKGNGTEGGIDISQVRIF